MRIATISEPKVVNTAVMQIWQWARENGHEVEHYRPLMRSTYDRVYASFLFTKTPKTYVPPEAICGGTGFDVKSKLPEEIEACGYDYSAYPPESPAWGRRIKGRPAPKPYSILWTSRGCFRNCEFCCVCAKEGRIRAVEPKNLNPHGKYVKVQDNNFFASPGWRHAVDVLHSYNQPVEFEGIDVRLLDDEQVEVLKSFRHQKQIKIAWDDPREDLRPKLEWLAERMNPSTVLVYVLIGFPFAGRGKSTHAENLHRVNFIRSLGMDPFVMPWYREDGVPSPDDQYKRQFARFVNPPGVPYKVCSWEEYQTGIKKVVA